MSAPEWKDTTSYQRDERGRSEPRTVELVTSGLRVIVTRHINAPDRWHVVCHDLNMSTPRILGAAGLEEAKTEALCVIGDRLEALSDAGIWLVGEA